MGLRGWQQVLLWGGVLFFVVIIISFIAGGEDSDTPIEPSIGNEGSLLGAVGKAVGASDLISASMDQSNVVRVRWEINDNLGGDSRMFGVRVDIEETLKAIATLGSSYTSVEICGEFPMVDVYGNVNDIGVVGAVFSRNVIDRIQWPTFNPDNLWIIGESIYIHPGFHRDDSLKYSHRFSCTF